MNEHIARFLNDEKNYKVLSNRKINQSKLFDKELDHKFCRGILLSSEIDDQAYRALIKSVNWSYSDLNVSKLPEDRITSLLREKKLKFTLNNLRYLVDSETKKHIDLIETDIDAFIEKKAEIDFLPAGYISKLISSKNLGKSDKGKILENIDAEQSFYDLFNVEQDFASSVSNFVIENSATLSSNFISELLNNLHDLDRKIRVVTHAVGSFDKETIFSLLERLDDPYSKITPKGQSISLPKSNLNIELSEALKKARYITNFNVKKLKVMLYRKHS